MSILSKLANLNKADNSSTRVEMTDLQVEQCKEALRRDNRGYNVQPNRFDMAQPYRVAINYETKWHNFGNFTDANTAAAIGTIISAAFFGEKAVAGNFEAETAEKDQEFIDWMADARNQEVIAKANGDAPSVHDGGALTESTTSKEEEPNPF